MAAHRYYRLYIKTNNGGAYLALNGLELSTTAGGVNLALSGNGTGSGSSNGQGIYPPSQAFDNNSSTFWVGVTTANEWLKWDFGAGNEKDIQEFRILQSVSGGIDAASTVATADFQHSDDGTNWTTRISITNPTTSGTRVYAGDIVHATVDIVAPRPLLIASGPASTSITAPAGTLDAHFGGYFEDITSPVPSLSATARSTYGENAAFITAPKPTLSAHFGGNAYLTGPAPGLTFDATGTALLDAAITAPAGTLEASGTATTMGHVAITAPSATLVGYSGAVCSITTSAGTLQASGTGGGVASVAITAPLFQLTASGTVQSHGDLIITAPAGRLVTGAQAYIIAPTATLTAIGTATVTATYEAYALNLRHAPRHDGQETNDEVTHYTNFPFTHIVRYKNSYFGANSTGLYLLEGTTDDGAAIPFDIETAKDDFGQAAKKTVVSTYFGGRIGPAETISLIAGDATPQPYAYTTPRGAAVQNHRQKFGRGIKARYYAIGISGSSAFELDALTLEIDQLTRRV